MAEEDQNQIQQKYMEYQIAEQQMKQLEAQLEKLDVQAEEIKSVAPGWGTYR